MFKKIFNFILDLLFPAECLGCKKENTYLCDNCLKTIKLTNKIEKFEHPLNHLDNIFSVASYNDKLLRQAIHLFKFRYIKELSKPLAKLMADFYKQSLKQQLKLNKPLIIPIPLHKKRFLERGFNQAELLAKNLANDLNWPINSQILTRFKNTPHQVGLNKKQRQTNIKNAFLIPEKIDLTGKTVILIDDVVTTGSTLDEAAYVLKKAKAARVYGLTLAKD